jgi:hypothetical protein
MFYDFFKERYIQALSRILSKKLGRHVTEEEVLEFLKSIGQL